MMNVVTPNKEYIELTFVKETATGKGLNTQFIMENTGDGYFDVTDGRIGIKVGPNKPKRYRRPIEEWENTFASKLSRGYLVTKTKKTCSKTVAVKQYKEIPDKVVKEIVDRLRNYADAYMEENFTVRVDDISDEMIAYGNQILAEIQTKYTKMSVAEFNSKLKVLYAAIPRRIDKLSDKLAKNKSDFVRIIEDEQEIYDLMIKQVRAASTGYTNNQTILDIFGVHIREVTSEEKKELLIRLGSQAKLYKKAWKVTLDKSEKTFIKFCNQENLTEENGGISKLFHGSKNELWWSILINSIWCEPEKHPDFHGSITGKAGERGGYFAPDGVKSSGYTSLRGSKWAHGTEATGFLALFKVATGKQYYGEKGYGPHFTWDVLQKVCPGAHCLWLKKQYSGFLMDEVIVYNENQFTIDYLIEIGE